MGRQGAPSLTPVGLCTRLEDNWGARRRSNVASLSLGNKGVFHVTVCSWGTLDPSFLARKVSVYFDGGLMPKYSVFRGRNAQTVVQI